MHKKFHPAISWTYNNWKSMLQFLWRSFFEFSLRKGEKKNQKKKTTTEKQWIFNYTLDSYNNCCFETTVYNTCLRVTRKCALSEIYIIIYIPFFFFFFTSEKLYLLKVIFNVVKCVVNFIGLLKHNMEINVRI